MTVYVFVDEGDWFTDDEPVLVGPYDTEKAATEAADGRKVMALLTPDEYKQTTTCRVEGCDEPYVDYGDGYDGYCPSCADMLYADESPLLKRAERGEDGFTIDEINEARKVIDAVLNA